MYFQRIHYKLLANEGYNFISHREIWLFFWCYSDLEANNSTLSKDAGGGGEGRKKSLVFLT